MKNKSLIPNALFPLVFLICCLTHSTSLQAINIRISFDLTQLQDQVAKSTITQNGVSLTVESLPNHDWGHGDGKINVDATNGLLVSRNEGASIVFSFSHDVILEGYTIINDPNISGIIHLTSNLLGGIGSDSDALTQGSHDFTNQVTITAGTSIGLTTNWNTKTEDIHFGSFNLTVVPETATYAAILGASALALTLYRRRRKP